MSPESPDGREMRNIPADQLPPVTKQNEEILYFVHHSNLGFSLFGFY